ncbi:hypothetical protein CT676_12615 [Bradyrhizobium sp. MOS001]|jgi:hypothetical protein|nr:hypothetical protein CT676_12615 [Bradyrhizobium sp. MOS001]
MPRLDRGIQYAAAEVVRACSPIWASGILDRPVKPAMTPLVWFGLSPHRALDPETKSPGDISGAFVVCGAAFSLTPHVRVRIRIMKLS